MTENQGGDALTIADHGRKIDRTRHGCSKSRGRSKSRRGRITFYHCGKPGHMKRECRIWKKEQKEQKSASPNQKSSNTNEGETTAVVSDSDVLFIVSMEAACLYTSSISIDWILDSRESHHVTLSKTNFVSYEVGDYG